MADATININAADKTKAGFMSAQRSLQKFSASAKQTTKGMLGTITGAGLGSALGVALGLNLQSIADKVARMITGVTEDVEDAYNRLGTASDDIAEMVEARMERRLTDQQRLVKLMEKELKVSQTLSQMSEVKTRKIGRGRGEREFQTIDVIVQAKMKEIERDRQKILDQIEALRDREIDKIKSLKEQLQEVEDSGRSAFAKLYGVTLKGAEQLDALRAAMSRVNMEQNALNDATDTEEILRRKIDLKKEEIDLATSLYEAEQGAMEAQREAAKIIGDGFENAITSGEKLTDVIKQLGMDLMKLALRNTVTNPLVDFLGKSSFLGGIFKGYGGPKAAGGSVGSGKSYMVGEKGPEMFTPSSAGHIIPNNALGGSSGGARTVYNIDARGADRTGLARLEQMIRETQSSIGPIAVRSVYSAAGRGMI
jgi:hypothetical protein